MIKNYTFLDNKSIEDSIHQVQDSMHRLQETIQNSSTYSIKNMHLNQKYNLLNDSTLTNPRLNEFNAKKKISFNNYLNNSKRLNFKRNKYELLNQRTLNNSYMTDIGKGHNKRNSNNNNDMVRSFNTETTFIKNQPKKASNIFSKYNTKYNTYNANNNKLKLNNQKKSTMPSKYYSINNIYLSNIYKPKKLNNKILSSNPSRTNVTKIFSNNNPTRKITYETRTEPNVRNQRKIQNLKNLDDLYKYGEYLSNELKISNDTNSELLENYINISSKLQNKNKEDSVINNKIKKLKEEEQELNKNNEEVKKNYQKIRNIIEKNNLLMKNNILEAQKKIDSKQKKISDLKEINLNLINSQKKYDNEIKELERILNEYNLEDINDQYEKKILQGENNNNNKKDEEKEILNKIYEYNIRNSVLKKDIEQLQKEENIANYIFRDSNNLFNENENDKYKYEEKVVDSKIKELQNKNEDYLNKTKEIENEINLRNNDIKEMQNEIEHINKNIIDIENKNSQRSEYYYLKNNNSLNLNKLIELDEEIKNLLLIKEQLLQDYDSGIENLNKIYNDKKGEIITESIDNETKDIIEENERLKEENDDIIQELNDLPNLKEEYDKLNQDNIKLKKEFEKNSSHK